MRGVKPPLAVSFDLDETLLDGSGLRESIIQACGEIAASHPALDPAQLVDANSHVWQQYWPEVEARWTLGSLTGASLSLEAWRRTLHACGCTDEAVAKFAAKIHGQLAREALRLFDDVRQFMEVLRRAQLRSALITNGASDTQREKLSALGIEKWFHVVVISGEIGVAKPDPSTFAFALNSMGVAPENWWHVGDSLTTDVAGAKMARLTSVWLNRRGLVRGQADPAPDIEVPSLSHLVPFLKTNDLLRT